MKIVPSINTLKLMLEESVKENTALYEEAEPLYKKSVAERKVKYEKEDAEYEAALAVYEQEMEKYNSKCRFNQKNPPIRPDNPNYMRWLNSYDFEHILRTTSKHIKDAESLLLSFRFTDKIVELTEEDTIKICCIVNWKENRNSFEREVEYVSNRTTNNATN